MAPLLVFWFFHFDPDSLSFITTNKIYQSLAAWLLALSCFHPAARWRLRWMWGSFSNGLLCIQCLFAAYLAHIPVYLSAEWRSTLLCLQSCGRCRQLLLPTCSASYFCELCIRKCILIGLPWHVSFNMPTPIITRFWT